MEIRSKRIRLRSLKNSDYPDIYGNISKEVLQWLPDIPYPYSLKDAKDYIKSSIKNYRSKTSFDFGILFEGRIIGTISLEKIDKHNKARISYLLNKNYWNRGIMTEAMEEILDLAFEDLKLNKLYTGVIPQNEFSLRLLKKFGFKKDGINREHYCIKDKYYDEIILSLLRKEYMN